LCLCAAACVAVAGFELQRGESAARRFLGRLRRDMLKSTVRNAFLDLGWPVELCDHMQITNDSAGPADRLGVFLGMMETDAATS
jgi:hypothetical protein